MFPKLKASLTVECVEMNNPMIQRSRFDETLVRASWILQGNESPVQHDNGSVSTTTVWGRTFRHDAAESKIRKQIMNLLERAAAYAEIPKYIMDLKMEIITRPEDDFKGVPVLLQDD